MSIARSPVCALLAVNALTDSVTEFEREQAKVKLDIKKYAAKGEISSAKILAKSIAKTNKTIERMHVSKTQLNSAAMKLKEQQSTLKVVGAMQLVGFD